ncbi:hypothetical protein GGX14DRAFT_459852 [Mycena pura]|uniref:RRM domain-containing protein n=1 Tax=Mycena pura TaxID=153505 RepID=A0AAD6VB62_9AGAR|nr:hypothetical protein GGX14DRAFT_459852 [Mycena pura]
MCSANSFCSGKGAGNPPPAPNPLCRTFRHLGILHQPCIEASESARRLILEAYDPCALFCSNINFDIDAAVLRTYFSEILTNPKTGKSRGLAFVAFSQASEAYAALHAAHGSEIHWRRLSLTYRVLRKVTKPRVPTSKTAGAQRQPQARHGAGGVDASMQEDAPSSDEKKDKSEDLKESTETAAPSPQASTYSNAAENSAKYGRCSELDHLQALYDAEVQQRTAAQAENALLRRELEAEKSARELAESRLKILQLEKDRPLWEEARQKREEAEKAARAREEACRREAEVEESRRKMREFVALERERKRAAEEAARAERLRREAEEKARQEKEERERQAREQEERARVAREARERQKREQRWRAATEKEEARCQNRDRQLWGEGDWTVDRALRRLRIQMDEFDKLKFSEAQPLTFSVVPWPLLTDPLALDLEEITWAAVESFFARMKARMVVDLVEYSNLIERVHRMFHPDKWKARGILATVLDEETRNSLEAAGNVVAQAVTPLWRKSKGYT